jgi:predicted RNA binding protein YcfA (HicA-like mRNA interferase family)
VVKGGTADDLVNFLRRHGWVFRRVLGGHHIYGKKGRATRLSIPVVGNRPLKAGLYRALLKTAGFVVIGKTT